MITDENAGSEDCNYTSGAVSVAIHIELGAVVDKEEGAARSTPGNEEELTRVGKCQRRYVGLCGVLLAFGGTDAEE